MSLKVLLQVATHHVKLFLSKPSSLPKIIVVLGPTASGKTSLAIELAKIFSGEIISADSRQIWKNFDIGTAKVTPAETQGIPHHLIDIIEADAEFTLWDWKIQAEQIITKLISQKKLPIIAGGTGLFIDALVDNFQLPSRNPTLRKQLEKTWQIDKGKTLHQKLQKLDPKVATKIPPSSHHHLVRTLELVLTNQSKTKNPAKFDTLLLGLHWHPKSLKTRIIQRTDQMLQAGLLAETQSLLTKFSPTLPAMTGIGYREVIDFLHGNITKTEMRTQIINHTAQYAKRQRTWWKRRTDIIWLDCK